MTLQRQASYFFIAGLLTLFAASPDCTASDNWPQFLGPMGNSVAADSKLPTEIGEDKNLVWKTTIHGRGWSSPVIWGNQIWIGTATEDGKKFYGICVEKDSGKILHDLLLFEEAEPKFCHEMNSYASPSPVIEEGRVYLHFGSYGTACVDTTNGNVLWSRRDLPCDHFRGPGSSPIIYKDLLIVHYDGFDFQYIVAMNKLTGETVWKKDRDINYETDNGDFKKAYCTPLIIEVDGQDQLISPTSKATLALNPLTGDEFWRIHYAGFSATARPLVYKDKVIINSGFGTAELFAVKPTGKGDVTDTHVVWHQPKGIGSKPSSVIANGLLFSVLDAGVLSCFDPETGEQIWKERLEGNQYSSTPLVAHNLLYLFDHNGNALVVEAAREYKLVSHGKLEQGCLASPAASGNALFVRTKNALYRFESK